MALRSVFPAEPESSDEMQFAMSWVALGGARELPLEREPVEVEVFRIGSGSVGVGWTEGDFSLTGRGPLKPMEEWETSRLWIIRARRRGKVDILCLWPDHYLQMESRLILMILIRNVKCRRPNVSNVQAWEFTIPNKCILNNVYIHIYTYFYICMYIHKHTHIHMWTCIYVYVFK